MSTESRKRAKQALGWLATLFVKPALVLAAGALVIVALGVAQRTGWIGAGGTDDSASSTGGPAEAESEERESLYICPMMCVPPGPKPGRCPVCAMELVLSTSGGSGGGERSIAIDPASRRVANIRTRPAERKVAVRTIRAVGRLGYDEGLQKTLSAYVDGRLDRLHVDYTGAVVNEGDRLALLYSPKLYTAQTEFLTARRMASRTGTEALVEGLKLEGIDQSARRKLLDLGMTDDQIDALAESGEPQTRLELVAPIHGTVVDKLAVEGAYVKTGQPIYQLADLSTLWLMIQLFPEDAALIRYGQRVEAQLQSLPGQAVQGRVAFVDPVVDARTRTIGVRVVVDNPDGRLKVGDYATAFIQVPVTGREPSAAEVYDQDLAGKWISPRHPQIIADGPGKCPRCGIDLVPASTYGYADQPIDTPEELVIPRSAVLVAGEVSIVYVEVEEGRFELRTVTLGPSLGEEVVVLDGMDEGEEVAVNGNFLIDSQMQLAGNPSLIDPTKADDSAADENQEDDYFELELPPIDGLEMELDDADGDTAVPELGSIEILEMAPPDAPNLAAPAEEDTQRAAALTSLSPEDRALARRQRVCPVSDMPLGSMGTPIKVDLQGTPVMLCCEGCRASLLAEPGKYLAKLRKEGDR